MKGCLAALPQRPEDAISASLAPDGLVAAALERDCKVLRASNPSQNTRNGGTMATNKVTIYVRLLDEGTEVSRPTEALDLGNGLLKLLPSPDYNSHDFEHETWEFLPGSVVRCEKRYDNSGQYLLAVRA
jgi:hypothetical protein